MSGAFFDELCLIITGVVIDYLRFIIFPAQSSVGLNNCGALGFSVGELKECPGIFEF